MALGLSAEQKERLLAARSYLLAQMLEIISERTAIINMLQARPCTPALFAPTSLSSPSMPRGLLTKPSHVMLRLKRDARRGREPSRQRAPRA